LKTGDCKAYYTGNLLPIDGSRKTIRHLLLTLLPKRDGTQESYRQNSHGSPESKKGVNISLEKYNLVRAVLPKLIQKHKEITFDQLTDLVEAELIEQQF